MSSEEHSKKLREIAEEWVPTEYGRICGSTLQVEDVLTTCIFKLHDRVKELEKAVLVDVPEQVYCNFCKLPIREGQASRAGYNGREHDQCWSAAFTEIGIIRAELQKQRKSNKRDIE